MKKWLAACGFQASPRQYPWVETRHDLGEFGSLAFAQWQHPGEGEKRFSAETVRNLRRWIRPGDWAIDVGAHSGDTAVAYGAATGPAGKVIAFEPNPFVFAVLAANAHLNHRNILAIPAAAHCADGVLRMQYSDNGYCNGGAHHGIAALRHKHFFTLHAPALDLRRFLVEQFADQLGRISFVKTDTEGNDLFVLQSLQPLIAAGTCVPRAIQVEFYKHSPAELKRAQFDLLAGAGYALFAFDDRSFQAGERIADRDAVVDRGHFDAIAVRADANTAAP